jgi:DNA-binding MarR family transcriptional regulator
MKAPTPAEFTDQLQGLMLQLHQALVKGDKDAIGKGEISVPQFWALLFLDRHPDAALNQAAEALCLSISSASGLIDRLVRKGYVRRTRCKTDRRRVLLSLSKKGRAVIEEIMQNHRKRMHEVYAPLSASERKQYLALIEKVVNTL